VNGSDEREFADTATTAIPVPPTFRSTNPDDIRYLLQHKMEDLEMWMLLRNTYGHPALLATSIRTDLLLLGESDRSIPDIPFGEF
jgi:hypothetical protein